VRKIVLRYEVRQWEKTVSRHFHCCTLKAIFRHASKGGGAGKWGSLLATHRLYAHPLDRPLHLRYRLWHSGMVRRAILAEKSSVSNCDSNFWSNLRWTIVRTMAELLDDLGMWNGHFVRNIIQSHSIGFFKFTLMIDRIFVWKCTFLSARATSSVKNALSNVVLNLSHCLDEVSSRMLLCTCLTGRGKPQAYSCKMWFERLTVIQFTSHSLMAIRYIGVSVQCVVLYRSRH